MPAGPQAALLPDGKRLHLHYGPIDLVIGADGTRREVGLAYRQAQLRSAHILPVLVLHLVVVFIFVIRRAIAGFPGDDGLYSALAIQQGGIHLGQETDNP